jgi:transcriptional regulator with XRE-family HTH domain
MITLEQVMERMSPARRKKIEARAAELIAEEMSLRELRRARKLTQVRVAKALRISQDGVSRLERRTDLMLSTLRKSVEAMGGSLSLVVEFPDRTPVVLSGIGEDCLPISRESRRTRRIKPPTDPKPIARKAG